MPKKKAKKFVARESDPKLKLAGNSVRDPKTGNREHRKATDS